MSLLVKHLDQLRPKIFSIPPIETRNLSQTLNTFVRCRVCLGRRATIVHSRSENKFRDPNICWFCEGSAVMSNRESDYDK